MNGRLISEAPRDGTIIVASIMRISGVPETGHHSFERLKWTSLGWHTANFSMIYGEASVLTWWPDGTPEDQMEKRPRTNWKWQPSNGTAGDRFYHDWCAKCIFEQPYIRDERHEGCDVFLRSLAHTISDPEYPEEWTDRGGQPHCTKFQRYHEELTKLDAEGNVVLPEPRCTETKDLFDV